MNQRVICLLTMCVGLAQPALSAVLTNQTTAAGSWHTGGNWSLSHEPDVGEAVIVKHNMLLTAPTPRLRSCIVSNAMITFSNWNTKLWVSNNVVLTQTAGRTNLTHAGPYGTAQMSNRVWVVCSNLTVQSSGMIDVSRRGYTNACGPGKGYGGSHFGYGGGYWTGAKYNSGNLYDSTTNPSFPGSGGYSPYGPSGGHGGGVVRIEASGDATVLGSIKANGQNGYDRGDIHASAGSGGAVYIECRRLLGSSSGSLQASGGSSGWAGWGGGGGGIAVIYNTTAQAGSNPGVKFETKGGMGGTYTDRQWADFGTLFLSDGSFLSTRMTNGQFSFVRFHANGFTNWNPASLLIGNYTVLDFGTGFHLNVTGTLRIDPYGQLGIREWSRLTVGGNIFIPQRGKLFVRSGSTNGLGRDYGTLVQVGGSVSIGEESWLYAYADPYNSGSVLFRVLDLTVSQGGYFEASWKGYAPDNGPGKALYGGAGHGGRGGMSSWGNPGGPIYGLTNAPALQGSGSAGAPGAEGGGRIRIEALRKITLDGTMRANGSGPHDIHYGGGSGGAIFIQCQSFEGAASGMIQANGGPGSYAGGGGGGGRIAVWYGKPVPAYLFGRILTNDVLAYTTYTNFRALTNFYGTNQASGNIGGFYGGTQPGETGTVVVIHYDPPLPSITNAAATNVTINSAWFNGYMVDTGAPPTTVKVFWGFEDGGAPTSRLWMYTNSVPGSWPAGSRPTWFADGLLTNRYFYYRFHAANVAGQDWSETTEIVLTSDLWVTAPDNSSTETGPTTGTLTIHRYNTNRAFRVRYQWGGTAEYGSDFTANPPGTDLWMPAGVASTNIVITPVWDGWNEPTETATLMLADAGYVRGSPQSNTVSITDVGMTPGINNSTGSGDWTNNACWSLGRFPIEDDVVTVRHAMTITTSAYRMASCTITNTTLTMRNWGTMLRASSVVVAGNGILTCEGPFTQAQETNRIYVVCSNFTVNAGGQVDASKKGYTGSNGLGKGYGASHGTQKKGYLYGVAYGSMTAPETPGSGGIGYSGGVLGGYGGGAIRIQATGTVTINGTVQAIGQDGYERTDIHASGGSGGSIYITCNRLEGSLTGLIKASGGNVGWNGFGGSGGRVAVIYNTTAQAGFNPGVRFHVAGGVHSERRRTASDGTLCLPDLTMFGAVMGGSQFGGARVFIAGRTNWSVGSLTVTNCDLTFGSDVFFLKVTNSLTVGTGGKLGFIGRAQMQCKNLVLTNSGDLVVYAGPTNSGGKNYSAVIQATDAMRIGSGSWIYPVSDLTNGGSALFKMKNLFITSGGGFDADGYGYGQIKGPGMGNGAGHGGTGGPGSPWAGPTYGSMYMPIRPGSGARNYSPGAEGGGEGGGAIRIMASRDVFLDGTFTANGYDGWGTHGGGGAGGTILVICRQFTGGGTAVMRANAGNGNNGYGAGGGGGRIAVCMGSPLESTWPVISSGAERLYLQYSDTCPTYAGTISMANGTGSAGAGQIGTKKFIYFENKGTILRVR